MLLKCCTQYARKFGKLSSSHRTGKSQFSFPKKLELLHNCTPLTHQQSDAQNAPSQASTACELWTSRCFKPDLEKAEEPEIKLATSVGWLKKQDWVPEKHLLLLYWLGQSLWLCGSQQTLENSSRWEYQTTWPASWEICMQFKKQQLELDMEQLTVFQIGKGVRQGCILSTCLFNLYAEYIIQNPRLHEAQAGIKTAGRNINNLRYADDTTLIAVKWIRTKELLDESERGEWKSWLKTQYSEN